MQKTHNQILLINFCVNVADFRHDDAPPYMNIYFTTYGKSHTHTHQCHIYYHWINMCCTHIKYTLVIVSVYNINKACLVVYYIQYFVCYSMVIFWRREIYKIASVENHILFLGQPTCLCVHCFFLKAGQWHHYIFKFFKSEIVKFIIDHILFLLRFRWIQQNIDCIYIVNVRFEGHLTHAHTHLTKCINFVYLYFNFIFIKIKRCVITAQPPRHYQTISIALLLGE